MPDLARSVTPFFFFWKWVCVSRQCYNLLLTALVFLRTGFLDNILPIFNRPKEACLGALVLHLLSMGTAGRHSHPFPGETLQHRIYRPVASSRNGARSPGQGPRSQVAANTCFQEHLQRTAAFVHAPYQEYIPTTAFCPLIPGHISPFLAYEVVPRLFSS